MKNTPLKILLVDQGKNTGLENGSKIGGGQIARRRFFSDKELFDVTLLTSEKELVNFWSGCASKIIFAKDLKTYRPRRTEIASSKVHWRSLINDGMRASCLLSRYLKGANHDVIFFNDNKSRLLYILAVIQGRCWRLKGKKAIQVDGEWILGFYDFLMRSLYLIFFDKIICPTNSVKKHFGPLRYFFEHKLFTAYPGVDMPPSSLPPKPVDTVKKPLVFGCIGTLRIESKAQDLVIKAVDLLVKRHGHLPVEVHFFGDGPDRDVLEKTIQNKGLIKYFDFKGYIADQERIYKNIDACIVTSRTETASIVIMESLVRNIPVIAPDLPACKELLSHAEGGLLFKKGEHEDLAEKIDSVLQNNLLQELRDKVTSSDKHIFTKEYQAKRVFDFLRY